MTGSKASLRPEMVLTRWFERDARNQKKKKKRKRKREKKDDGRKSPPLGGDNRPSDSRVPPPIDGTELLVEIVTRSRVPVCWKRSVRELSRTGHGGIIAWYYYTWYSSSIGSRSAFVFSGIVQFSIEEITRFLKNLDVNSILLELNF